jgi:periplasmic protein TonB
VQLSTQSECSFEQVVADAAEKGSQSRMYAGSDRSDSVHRVYGGILGLSVANLTHELPLTWQGGLSARLPRDTQDEREDSLFRESLIVSGRPRKQNPWATVGALAFQALVLAALIITPLYFTDPLPKKALVTELYLPQPPAAAAAPAESRRITAPTKSSEEFITPNPKAISIPRTHDKPPVTASTVSGVSGGVPGGIAGGVIGGVPGGTLGAVLASTSAAPVLAKTEAKKVRIASRVAEGNLIHDVAPEYPPEAGRARLEGSVVLLAVISKDGTVEDVQVKSGLPVLAQAAIDAVKQWRYRPYLLNGEPVEVATQITINFTLAGG